MKTALVAAVIAFGLGSAPAWAEQALIKAVRANDTAAAVKLIEAGEKVNAPEPNGTTALQWAAYNGNLDLVERLIKAGAKANVQNRYGSSPMSEAAELGRADIIKQLLKAGADVESPNADGQTALMIVARTNSVEAAKLLIDHGANVNAREKWHDQTATMWAASQCQPDMIRLLAKHGADLDAHSRIDDWARQVTAEPRAMFRPVGGWTALLYAARQGCVEAAKALIESGADPNIGDGENMAPLLIAITNLHFDLAKYLLEKGANPNEWDWRGHNPLYAAVDVNTLPHGGWPDRPSTDKTTSFEMVKLLLDAGANPNLQLKLNPLWRYTKDDRGKDMLLSIGATPLLRAAKGFDVESIELLLAHGAIPDLPNSGEIFQGQIGGITPLMAAAGLGSTITDSRGTYDTPDVQERSIAAIAALLKGGADINAKDDHGRTALHSAASWGWTKVVRYLVANGANIMAADADGMKPLDAAMGKMKTGRLDGRSTVHDDTAAVLRELMSKQTASRAFDAKQAAHQQTVQ